MSELSLEIAQELSDFLTEYTGENKYVTRGELKDEFTKRMVSRVKIAELNILWKVDKGVQRLKTGTPYDDAIANDVLKVLRSLEKNL
jgi:hypothetical protein